MDWLVVEYAIKVSSNDSVRVMLDSESFPYRLPNELSRYLNGIPALSWGVRLLLLALATLRCINVSIGDIYTPGEA